MTIEHRSMYLRNDLRSVLLWDITQRRVVILHWRFGRTYLSHLQGPRSLRLVGFWRTTSWPLKVGSIGCPETSVKDYHSRLCNIAEERRSQHHGGSMKSEMIYSKKVFRWKNLCERNSSRSHVTHFTWFKCPHKNAMLLSTLQSISDRLTSLSTCQQLPVIRRSFQIHTSPANSYQVYCDSLQFPQINILITQ
jgi:hypothetical protein